MRAVFWIVGAFASAVGGAYLINRRANQRAVRLAQLQLSTQFLAALHQESFAFEAFVPGIVPPGVRIAGFRGHAAGVGFEFAGQTDGSGTRWRFFLVWGAAQVVTDWNPLHDETEHPLKQAYDILRRRSSKDDGLSN